MSSYTDIFIKRPVLAVVISLLILVLGLRSMGALPVQQYPTVESAIITVNTAYTGADPASIAAFITTPLENAVAQANGIDYLTSNSVQNTSMIQANLVLNYDPDKALTEINTQVNSVLNQLPAGSQTPVVTINVGESIDSMYLGFYSPSLQTNQITDYLLRAVQPKLQAVHGVQQAQILGNSEYALRVWLNPQKLAGLHITPAEIARVLRANNFVSAAGRTDGNSFVLNLTANTNLTSVTQFENMVIKADNNTVVRLKDVAKVTMGSENYNTSVSFNAKPAVYIGIVVAPGANLLTVLDNVRKVFFDAQAQLPQGLDANIVYDASAFVNSSIDEVTAAIFEAFIIITFVVFFFLGSLRALIIPTIAIPLSIIGTFFMMLVLGYSINLLTLLALVLAIGLVVDDAIIVVENVHRHIEEGKSALSAALLSARELTRPIVAITVVLVAVYLPIGFMGGLTGALFTEFAFTLASAVTISAIIALTLSPMMCSRLLKTEAVKNKNRFILWVDRMFDGVRDAYARGLGRALGYLAAIVVFAIIILSSNYFLFTTSKSELAPQEDQGIILTQSTGEANASLAQTAEISNQISAIFHGYPETQDSFEINGITSANNPPALNGAMGGMVLKPWGDRKRTTNQLQPLIQAQVAHIAGAQIATFQLPSLPGGGAGMPVQFVIETTASLNELNQVMTPILAGALASGKFSFLQPDLRIDQQQTTINLNRDKIAEFGLTMQDVGNSLSAALSENYVNYFNFMGRSYEVIPQMLRDYRLNDTALLSYYINTASGQSIPLATVASLEKTVVPESINHFQQLNSVTISAVPAPGVSMGEALTTLNGLAQQNLPEGYDIDYAGQSRQYVEESSALLITFALALIIIYLALSVLFNSFRASLIVLISVPMSICGAMIFISLGVGGATLNIYTEVGLVTLIGLISKHGILIVQFANDLQDSGKTKMEAIQLSAAVRFRPIIMTTLAMVLGVVPLIMATGAGAVSRFDIGLVIATGISIGTCFTLFVVPAMYILLGENRAPLDEASSAA